MDFTAAVITVSDKGARGEREDTSGPALVRLLEENGYTLAYTALVPDEPEGSFSAARTRRISGSC